MGPPEFGALVVSSAGASSPLVGISGGCWERSERVCSLTQ